MGSSPFIRTNKKHHASGAFLLAHRAKKGLEQAGMEKRFCIKRVKLYHN